MFRVITFMIAAAIVLPWGRIPSVQAQPDVIGKCVCEAARIRSQKSVVVRGTGGFTRDEPVLFDFGCPIAKFESEPMPTAIVLEITSFASNDDREKFNSLKNSLDRDNYDQAFFQLVLRGSIECKPNITIPPLSDGGPGFGDGFGHEGFYKCKVKNGKVLSFKEIVRPETRNHSQ
jgi:hypothetical protein